MKKRIQPAIGEFFDIVGSKFDSRKKYFSRHFDQMQDFCDACFNTSSIEGRVCLDAGCGTGTTSIYFATAGARHVFGLDLSKTSLQIAQAEAADKMFKNTLFTAGNMDVLPFGDKTIDIVFSCGALPYVRNFEHCLSEFIRVTKSQGCIVFMALKRSRLDIAYEYIRLFLHKVPRKFKPVFAKFIALVVRLPSNYLLGRQVMSDQGKPLEQTIMEAFFSPIRLNKVDSNETRDFFIKKGFAVTDISAIDTNDFYSSQTGFVLKAVRE